MKTTRLVFALAVALALQALPAHAQSSAVPGTISYQGRVTNDDGTLVGASSPTERTVIFRIWDNATATGQANLLYSEKQTVTISKGEFSVLVGNGDPVTGSPRGFDEVPKKLASLAASSLWAGSSRFLGVTVCDEGTDTGPEVAPRQQIASTVYSIKAREAETVSGINNGPVSLGTTLNGVFTEQMSINGNGDVGIGTAGRTIDGKLNIYGASPFLNLQNNFTDTGAGSGIRFGHDQAGSQLPLAEIKSFLQSGGGAGQRAGDLVFSTSAAGNLTERMRISSIGNVGIGTAGRTIDGKLHISGDNPVLHLQNNNAGAGTGSTIRFGHDQAGSQLPVAEIRSALQSGAGTGSRAGDLVFFTSGAGSLAEQMRLNSIGDLQMQKKSIHFNGNTTGVGIFGTISDNDQWGIFGESGGVNSGRMIIRTGDDNNEPIQFWQSGTHRMAINDKGNVVIPGWVTDSYGGGDSKLAVDGGIALYYGGNRARLHYNGDTGAFSVNVSRGFGGNDNRSARFDGDANWDFDSDRRLKTDITPAEPVLDRILDLPLHRFRYKTSTPGSVRELGVIAQEVQPVFPELVGQGNPAPEGDNYLTVGTTSFGLYACKAIQELADRTDSDVEHLQAEIAAKDAKIADLEARLTAIEAALKTK